MGITVASAAGYPRVDLVVAGNERLTAKARQAISKSRYPIFVSAASAWEIATKFRLGKLPIAAGFVNKLAAAVADQNFLELPVSFQHADLAGRLPNEHRDPWDRMIVAQAISENLTLVSNERVFDAFGASRIW